MGREAGTARWPALVAAINRGVSAHFSFPVPPGWGGTLASRQAEVGVAGSSALAQVSAPGFGAGWSFALAVSVPLARIVSPRPSEFEGLKGKPPHRGASGFNGPSLTRSTLLILKCSLLHVCFRKGWGDYKMFRNRKPSCLTLCCSRSRLLSYSGVINY